MLYLSGKLFVHRDLAARNILISDDKTTCKVYNYGAYGNGMLKVMTKPFPADARLQNNLAT